MPSVKKVATVVQLAEARVHQVARQTLVYQRCGHVVWLNRAIKRVIRLTSWLVLAVLLLEVTVGFTGLTFLYWVYRMTLG